MHTYPAAGTANHQLNVSSHLVYPSFTHIEHVVKRWVKQERSSEYSDFLGRLTLTWVLDQSSSNRAHRSIDKISISVRPD